jgi:hypothetical protein
MVWNLEFNIFAMSFDEYGVPDVNIEEIRPIYDAGRPEVRTLVPDEQGGIFLIFTQSQHTSSIRENSCYYIHLHDSPDPLFNCESVRVTPIFRINELIWMVEAVPDGEHGVLLAWIDSRRSGNYDLNDVYCQRINDNQDVYKNPHLSGEWRLYPAYPNPFNPSTSVTFEIPSAALVNLSVYDLLGRKVTNLVNRKLNTGEYKYWWHGIDSKGIPVASGTYFINLEADSHSETKKVILLR